MKGRNRKRRRKGRRQWICKKNYFFSQDIINMWNSLLQDIIMAPDLQRALLMFLSMIKHIGSPILSCLSRQKEPGSYHCIP